MITVRGAELRAGARLLLSDISFTVSPGDRIGLVGRNDAGKTTLMTALAGRARPAAGTVTCTGPAGFLAQEHDTLARGRPVRENLAGAAPHLTDGEVRRVLGAFLFTGDDADKPAGVLSGREKAGLALAGLVHSGVNVLLLERGLPRPGHPRLTAHPCPSGPSRRPWRREDGAAGLQPVPPGRFLPLGQSAQRACPRGRTSRSTPTCRPTDWPPPPVYCPSRAAADTRPTATHTEPRGPPADPRHPRGDRWRGCASPVPRARLPGRSGEFTGQG